MQTAHAQSQPGVPGQKPGLLNNIWSQSESAGWPVSSSANSGWSQPSHIQGSGPLSAPGDSSATTAAATSELGWGAQTPVGGIGASPWGPPTSRSDSLVVDKNDKDAWPSIGDNSETGSNIDEVETGSAKSGSVISSSSNPGVSSLGDSLSTSSGLPAQNSSSMGWGSSSFGSSSDKLDGSSGNSWGIGPDSSSLGGSSMWGANPASSQTSGLGTTGWGSANSGRDNGAEQNGSGWQGVNYGSGGMNLQQSNAASSADGWGAPSSNSSSVIASSISSPLDYKGASAIGSSLLNSASNNTAAAASGWGSAEPPPKPDSQSTGWGSPSPTSALQNTGAEAWGQPKKQPPNMSSGWGQQTPQSATTGWGQPEIAQKPTSNWGEPAKPSAAPGSGWGQSDQRANAGGAWGQTTPEVKPDTSSAAAGWGAKPATQPQAGGWGTPASSASTAAWDATPSSQPQATSAAGSWGATQPTQAQNVQQQLPRPIGAAQPQPTQPSSWADAASRGLPPKALERSNSREEIIQTAVNCNDGWGKTPVRQDTSWDMMEESPKMPRKSLSSTSSNSSQDNNTWNQPNDGTAIWKSSKDGQPPPQQQPPSNNSWGAQGPSSAPPQPPQQVGPASSTHWGNPDADGGTWEGPPDAIRNTQPQNTNMWSGPPGQPGSMPQRQNSNQWGGDDKSGQWGSGSSSSEWGSDKSNNGNSNHTGQWAPPKRDDNVWDRDGTHTWGSGGPPSRSNSSTDFGTWGGSENRQQGQPGPGPSWSDNAQNNTQNWGRNGPPPGNVDNGTAYWGDPGKGSWGNQGRGGPDRPAWAQEPKGGWNAGQQGPKNDAAIFTQDAKAGSWGDTSVSGWSAMKPRQPAGPGSWGDAPDWSNPNAAMKGPMNDMSRPPPQPQMRSRMLLQLTNMGFRKDDAQRALINNNMNLESAIRDLVQHPANHDMDGEQKGRALRSMHPGREDLSVNDPHVADLTNPLVPPPLAGNVAALTNAQLAAHGNAALANHLKQPAASASLQNPSSLTAPSINPMLQKQLGVGKQPSPQGQPIRGAMQSHQQQLLHSQLAQQLQLAVQTGLVSPQLLNQGQLAPNMLIMLQQLLQLAQLLQRLVHQQQMIQQNRQLSPQQQRSQQEQLAVMITKIKQQILHQQQQIQAQQVLAKQQAVAPPTPVIPANQTSQAPPTSMPPNAGADPSKELDMSGLNIINSAASTAASQSQPQSRLNQWIKDTNPAAFKHSHSTPNLPGEEKVSGGLLSDSTWSPSVSGNSNISWPGATSGNTTTSTSSVSDAKIHASSESPAGSSAGSNSAQEGPDGQSLDIEEFVPGKPWQGSTIKSVEDDPFITPASVSRSLSVNQVREEHLSILGGNKSSASSPGDGMGGWGGKQQWSTGDDWNKAGNGRAQPGVAGLSGGAALRGGGAAITGGFNRSMSMPATSHAFAGNPAQRWNGQAGNWLVLKNLSSRIDQHTLETLCKQHGPLQTFYLNPQYGQALVCYKTRDAALRAQQALNSCQLANMQILADFVSEGEAALVTKSMGGPGVAAPTSMANLWSAPQSQVGAGMKSAGMAGWGQASAGSLWGNPAGGMDDHLLLPENLI